jgi:hypothetical protein
MSKSHVIVPTPVALSRACGFIVVSSNKHDVHQFAAFGQSNRLILFTLNRQQFFKDR